MYVKLAEVAGIYPVPNLAVEVCCEMYSHAKQQAIESATALPRPMKSVV